jgi:Large ribosomal RNA subunit accumulation protein YceD
MAAMAKPRSERMSERPWSVPIAFTDVPETGRHFDLSADERTRSAIAELAGLRALPRLEAAFDVSRRGRDGLHVAGRVSATVGQTCVVTLDPVDNEIEEQVDLAFAPAMAAAMSDSGKAAVEMAAEERPEALVADTVDLGAIAVEFLILGIDPYPRRPGAVFEAPAPDDRSEHPFAALAVLKRGQGTQS